MVESTSVEPGYSDSPSPISEPPDITNWFSSYVYESLPLCSLVKESENQDLSVAVSQNKDHNKPMNKRIRQNEDRKLYESPLPCEPPDVANWFSSYVYESPMLDTSDGLELSVLGESECIKERETEKETTNVEGNNVCPKFYEQEPVSSSKVTDLFQSQSILSEPPDVRNWFSSYEYQSPELSDSHELGFSACEKDKLIIDESDTEEEHSSGIFRKTRSKQDITSLGGSISNDNKENIAANTAKEISSDNAYSEQEMEKHSSVGLFDALNKQEKEESSLNQEPLFCESVQEPSFSLGVSWDSQKPQSPVKENNEASLHELSPKHIQETISLSSSRQKSPRKAAQKACLEENEESDNKENAHKESTETGFVTMKKARDGCSMKKPNRGLLEECLRSKELKKMSRKVDKEEEERKKKKRRVLGEMSNQQFSGTEEITGKWRCPQKNKGNLPPPLKQLRLDAWIHKVV